MKTIVKWFINNPVAANLLMLVVILGGIIGYQTLGKIVFPSFETDNITVTVPYRGAGPAEVEDRILIRVEEAVYDLSGVKRIRSRASEGFGTITIEVEEGVDAEQMLNKVKARVDAINTFPGLSERPIVSRFSGEMPVMQLSIAGNLDERELKELGRMVRDRLATVAGTSRTELQAVRDYEISIEISEYSLQKYGLTFDDVARAVSRSSTNMPAGSVDSDAGQIQIVTRGQAYDQKDFEDIVVLRRADGTRVLLKDIATVRDGFTDKEFELTFKDKRAIVVAAFINSSSENDTSPDVVQVCRDMRKIIEEEIVPSIAAETDITIFFDASEMYKGRLNMLLENGISGLILVFVGLVLFLTPRLAGWVTLGIAVSFLGSFIFLQSFGVSLSMLSLFSFILVLGIVVDDAIIVGESVHLENEKGVMGGRAALDGTLKVSKPVIFSALTTMVTFLPLAFLPGPPGKIAYIIPVVVILCLAFSLIECLLILPSHLRHSGEKKAGVFSRIIRMILPQSLRDFVSGGVDYCRHKADAWLTYVIFDLYRPFLDRILRNKLMTFSIIIACSSVVITIQQAGWVKSSFMPNVTSDFVSGTIQFPVGSPFRVIKSATATLEKTAKELGKQLEQEYPDMDVIEGIVTVSGGVDATVMLILEQAVLQDIDIEEVAKRWRKMVPVIPDARGMNFSSSIMGGPGGGLPRIDLLLKSSDLAMLEAASNELKAVYATYDGLYNITDSGDSARMEAELHLLPSAENLGLSLTDLAQQVRQAFYGQEVQRVPRGPDDVRVMVRLPKKDRKSFDMLDDMRIRPPGGEGVPFESVAEVKYKKAYATIERTDRQRTLLVSANVDEDITNSTVVLDAIREDFFDLWKVKYPAVDFSLEGSKKDEMEFTASAIKGFGISLVVIYILMAVAFRSYVQPFLILTAIPFAYMGAVLGHLITGHNISVFSVMGMMAAAGVVINDNLVLLDYINRLRAQGYDALRAVEVAAEERFRPIFLTSFTTFIGLLPIMSETSIQAQFMIPTVISLAFGVLFAAIATLILMPVLYLFISEVREKLNWLLGIKEPIVNVSE